MGKSRCETSQPLDAASQRLARSLLACAEGDLAGALADLDYAYRLWHDVGYIYQSAIAQCWQAFVHLRMGAYAKARAHTDHAIALLSPFGAETPALLLVREWSARATKEIHDE